jgi:hypothetical protein
MGSSTFALSTSVSDADATTKGVLKLTGDLGGTAASPTVPGLAAKAPLASPALTGTPTAPTATGGTNTTQIATTAFVASALAGSSGTPGGSTTQLQYNNAGAFAGSANLIWDDTNSLLKLGGTLAGGNLPTTDRRLALLSTGGLQMITGAFGTTAAAGVAGYQGRGTVATPTASQANDILGSLTGRGFGATQWTSASTGGYFVRANQIHTDTNHGTYLTLEATPDGSSTRAEMFRVNGDNTISMNANTTKISAAELGYLSGVTSAIQTQLNATQPLDATLTALAALDTTTGYLKQTGTDTFTKTSTVAGADVSGNISGNAAGLSTALVVGSGGTGQTTYTDGQLLIGNTTGNTLAKGTITGTSNQVTVTNGAGSITLSTPQNIHTAATPTFAGVTIGQINDSNAVAALVISPIASAVNYVTLANAATAGIPTLTATSGTDTNVGLTIVSKGTGQLGVKSATNSTDAFSILKSDGNRILRADTTNTRVSVGGNTAPTSTLHTLGSFSTNLASKTTTYSIAATDYTILGDTTGGAFTVTLPTAASITGRIYVIKRTSASANNLTVGTTSSQTIDGATTKVLGSQYACIAVQSDGTNWQITALMGTVT